MRDVIGLDFGTTNSAIALLDGEGRPALAKFVSGGRYRSLFRSVIYFDPEELDALKRLVPRTGPEGIARYLELRRGRLLQSLKSHLASESLERTRVGNQVYELEELVGLIVGGLLEQAERYFGALPRRVVAGRPVRFAGGDAEVALSRLRAALGKAGLEVEAFVFEPVAAAWHYASRLKRAERVLIADFGGGTSDFTVVTLDPEGSNEVLKTDGVAVAGDAFDARVVEALVAPALGRGSQIRSVFGRLQRVPPNLYSKLRRWHHLSFLRTPRTREVLERLHHQALEPEKIEAFQHVIEEDLGYALYRAVERLKVALSERRDAVFRFVDGPVSIEAAVSRADFEAWIAPELEAIEACVDATLEGSGRVDRVFLTGGSSQVPAVRQIFERRFGAERVDSGEQLTSVASGLARWSAQLM